MKFSSVRGSIISGLLLLLSLAGCGGGGNGSAQEPINNTQGTDSPSSGASAVQNDADLQAGDQTDTDSLGGVQQCDVADFDFAELVFTETDRQWYCSVSQSQSVTFDEVFFSRNGSAFFSQYGQVYWNRNLTDDTLTIASPLMPTAVMKEINSANTTLQFTFNEGVDSEALYDCVLVQREDVS